MTDASQPNVDRLVDNLGGKDPVQRREARAALTQIGSPAVPQLLSALQSAHQHVRWEAAKTLGEIADPAAARGLVLALGDKDNDVRWVVAEALIALGREAIKPLLTMLTQSDPVHRLYQGAHHVLHDLAQRPDLAFLLEPVLKAFKEPEPGVAVPVAAAEALKEAANHASD
jgi:HEAT repeat protein